MADPGMSGVAKFRGRVDRSDGFDLLIVGAVTLFVIAATVVGRRLLASGEPIFAGAAPLQGSWDLRTGVGTVLSVTVALVVVTAGVRWTRSAKFSQLWLVTWVVSMLWVLALAWIDPWAQGVTQPLLSPFEYLADVDRISSWADLTSDFTASIPSDAPQPWTTHVSSHPPGALAPFVLLDKVGLRGAGPAAAMLITIGTSTAAALIVTARKLVGVDAARRLAPFAALAPGAVWIVSSADAMFMGVAAWGVTLVAVASGASGRQRAGYAVCAGLLLATALYMSYGMTLILLVAASVLALRRAWKAAVWVAVGGLLVVAAVTFSGFWWFDGYQSVVERYYDGYGGVRPQSYWVWANLAAFALALGPAALVGLRRARGSIAVVAWSATAAVLLATLGGLSKAEVERIWLPFGAWVLFAAAAIPLSRTRVWLAAQAATVIVVAHLLVAPW
ncbi:MAG: hypothetical protein ABI720_07490 [Actinomycetes bacterium]